MIRRHHPPLHLLALIVTIAIASFAGCGESGPRHDEEAIEVKLNSAAQEGSKRQSSILEGVVQLIRTASETPGGSNFQIATDNLNQYFEIGTKDEDYRLSEKSRAFLASLNTKPAEFAEIESRSWGLPDARHIEDCLTFQVIASRIAGDGPTLDRIKRLFDWTIRHVHLAPPGWEVDPRISQAKLRPYDVVISGLAVEEGDWSERSWVFISLCRQINVDAAVLAVRPKGPADPQEGDKEKDKAGPAEKTWAVAALADGAAYLFDLKRGITFPGPDPARPATFQEVVADPSQLSQLDLPDRPYPIRPEDLRDGKIVARVDSSRGFMRPKMKLLQGRLYGDTRMILYRDPAEQVTAFVDVLGERCQEVGLWALPREVETRLFTDQAFVQATQMQLAYFSGLFPALVARVAQLRGESDNAKTMYVNFRFADKMVAKVGGAERPVDPGDRAVLDVIATYMLGLCHLERGDLENARLMFEQAVKLTDEPAWGKPPHHLYRWAAISNLAWIAEQQKRIPEAIRDYNHLQQTPEGDGNRLKAQRLILANPTVQPAPARPAKAEEAKPAASEAPKAAEEKGPKAGVTAPAAEPKPEAAAPAEAPKAEAPAGDEKKAAAPPEPKQE